jgi:hypothetical protein
MAWSSVKGGGNWVFAQSELTNPLLFLFFVHPGPTYPNQYAMNADDTSGRCLYINLGNNTNIPPKHVLDFDTSIRTVSRKFT